MHSTDVFHAIKQYIATLIILTPWNLDALQKYLISLKTAQLYWSSLSLLAHKFILQNQPRIHGSDQQSFSLIF